MRKCVGSYLVCQPQKRWIDSINDCLKKRGLMLGKIERWYITLMNGVGL